MSGAEIVQTGDATASLLEAERRLLASIAGHPAKILRVYEALGSGRFTLDTHRDILAALVHLTTTDRPATLSTVAHGFATRGKGEKRFVAAAARARDLIAYADENLDVEAELRFLGTAYGYRDAKAGLPDPILYESKHATLDEYAAAVEDYARRLKDAAAALRPLTTEQLAVHLDEALKELSLDEDDSADWLIEGLIGKRSIGMLAGAPQTGKTTLVTQLALCLANGRSVIGHTVHAPKKVLYLLAEGSRAQFLQRVQKAAHALDIRVPSGPWFMQGRDADVFEIGKPGFESIIASTQPDLVVLDTVFKFAPGVNENHADEWRAGVYRPLFTLSERYGTGFLLLHHAKKNGTGGWEDVAGSFAMYGDTDFFLRLKNDDDSTATLFRDKVRGRPKGETPLTFIGEKAIFSSGRERRYSLADSQREAAILEAINAIGKATKDGAVNYISIRSSISKKGFPDVTNADVLESLGRMKEAGLVQLVGDRDWRIAPTEPTQETLDDLRRGK